MKERLAALGLCLMLSVGLLCFFAPQVFAMQEPAKLEAGDVSARAAALYCPDTGEMLFEKAAGEQLPIASTTKIMTALLAVEHAMPELNICVTEKMVQVEGSSMGLLPGDNVTLRNLTYGMLLESGNDAANVTAHVLGGGIEGFARLMNEKARALGMQNTQFVTPSGLDAPGHYSTAHDMALLAANAVRNPEFAAMCAQKSVRVSYGNPPYLRTLSNHNRLLDAYEGCFGIKTGFTKKSGRCLVTAARRGGITLVCVTLNAPNDWEDHRKLLDYGFSQVNTEELPVRADLRADVVGGVQPTVRLRYAGSPFAAYTGDLPQVKTEIYKDVFLYAPVRQGKIVGRVVYRAGSSVLAEVPLIAAEDVAAAESTKEQVPQKPSLFSRGAAFLRRLFGA